jgi:hypothetical protein
MSSDLCIRSTTLSHWWLSASKCRSDVVQCDPRIWNGDPCERDMSVESDHLASSLGSSSVIKTGDNRKHSVFTGDTHKQCSSNYNYLNQRMETCIGHWMALVKISTGSRAIRSFESFCSLSNIDCACRFLEWTGFRTRADNIPAQVSSVDELTTYSLIAVCKRPALADRTSFEIY